VQVSGVWVVQTEPWVLLHPLLRHAVWQAVAGQEGVRSLTDLEVISPETLKDWCLPAEQSLAQTRTRRKRKSE
jgi:hypothetical protein